MPAEYKEQLELINETYLIKRTPKVLILREYGTVARIYSTVNINLKDRSSG